MYYLVANSGLMLGGTTGPFFFSTATEECTGGLLVFSIAPLCANDSVSMTDDVSISTVVLQHSLMTATSPHTICCAYHNLKTNSHQQTKSHLIDGILCARSLKLRNAGFLWYSCSIRVFIIVFVTIRWCTSVV